ncbi:hypothetical protein [Streptomyces griseiscabiei]|uniref:Uncharacterized protein n=1 Tax=Streptomyces griseiscabiei TaxID=2993540 RepID=A0ABU4L6R6_9ACTN|nr:hypothetical protein [Streptomyces griseiscabiei]MBZ3906446.1 hypothetical protein [Streptomyces griseiscabiei]MDX2911441.1 hypothetical protein [Streptomyces griseiscabiei]
MSSSVGGTECDTLIEDRLETDLDAGTRKVVARHFHPEAGSPYRLRRAARPDFDARGITRHERLTAFGPFPVDIPPSQDPADLVPLDVPRPPTGRVRDTGGTTGTPCRVFSTPAMLLHRGARRRRSFVTEGFAQGRTCLQATRTGPHLVDNGVGGVGPVCRAGVRRRHQRGGPARRAVRRTHALCAELPRR